MQPPWPAPRLAKTKTGIALAISAGLVTVGTWAAYWAPNRNDQYELIYLGACVHDGARLYVDCWENKPPGIAWINALGIAIWGENQFGAWLLPGAFAAAALLVFWACVRAALGSQVARYAVILAAILATLRLYDSTSSNPDFYAFLFELTAASLLTLAFTAEGTIGLVAAGVSAGLAFAAATCVKPVGLVGLLAAAMVSAAVLIARSPQRRRCLATTILATIGFAAGIAGTAWALARQGLLDEAWYAAFGFNTRFIPSSLTAAFPSLWPKLQRDLLAVQLPLWLALVGAVAALSGRARLSRAWAATWVLWMVAAGWFAISGPSAAMRYWHGLWAPTLCLAAVGLDAMLSAYRQADSRSRPALVVLYATMFLLLMGPLAFHYRLGVAEAYLAFTGAPNERQRLTEIGRQLADLVPAGKRIYILDYDIGPYLYAGRFSAVRFTHPRSPESMDEILETLETGAAHAILEPSKLTGFFARWCEQECRTRLQSILQDYSRADEIDGYTVWIRRDHSENETGD